MSEPPVKPLFSPKPGLTKEEQKKVSAFIKSGRMKICPPPFSQELIAMGIARGRQWAEGLTDAMKLKLGMIELKRPERTEQEKRKIKGSRNWRGTGNRNRIRRRSMDDLVPPGERSNPVAAAKLWLGKRLVEKPSGYWLDGVPANLTTIMRAFNRLRLASGVEQLETNPLWRVPE